MPPTTLSALQALKAEEFHALCDELLPRIDARYHPLVPHGRNDVGDSIKGQPDSYVGNSASTCRIAVQYTVQKDSWWTKAVEDVVEARKACPTADEIVLTLPRDVDRDTPSKGKAIHWQNDARLAAETATLTVINGRNLAQQLDTCCQDLRFHFLGIPFSRLSWEALNVACQKTTETTIGRLQSLERFVPDRYVDRDADDRLFKLWQDALRHASERGSSGNRRHIVPLVADSGIGKTSMLARFASRTSPTAPVLFLLARDFSFDSAHSLTVDVLTVLQGCMDAGCRNAEEAYLDSLLISKTPVTVILDGLDEATDASGVRRAIDGWLSSRLGKSCVLLLSSRPEFWRKCRSATWSNAILSDDEQPRAVRTLRHERDMAELDPLNGIELPGLFTQVEETSAWKLGQQHEDEYWRLPADVRNELSHPFTMRSALDLVGRGENIDNLATRSSILDLWVQRRLQEEIDAGDRITATQFRESLVTFAQLANVMDGSWVSVDDLKDVPRFSPSQPPGPVIELLVNANILETHPEKQDCLRFTFEALQDYFLAESLLRKIAESPEDVARDFAGQPFSIAVSRLQHLGNRILNHPQRDGFVRALAELNVPMAATVLRAQAMGYNSERREQVVSKLAHMLESRFNADIALATELLGRIRCPESEAALQAYWNGRTPSGRIHHIASYAAISNGIVSLVSLVFSTWWFIRDEYFVDVRPELLATTPEFRRALSDYAAAFLPAEEHSENYRRAVTVLTYLNDERVVDVIEHRTCDAMPYFYESQALLAIGTVKATHAYSQLVDQAISRRTPQAAEDQGDRWMDCLSPHPQIATFLTDTVEQFVLKQLTSDISDRRLLGYVLAKWLGSKRLLEAIITNEHGFGSFPYEARNYGRRLGCDRWIELWNKAASSKIRKSLLKLAGQLRDARIEKILFTCLDYAELAGTAALELASMGSHRACTRMRKLMLSRPSSDEPRMGNQRAAFYALCTLRDPSCVADVVRYLEDDENANQYDGAIGLASIGTPEAEEALLGLRNQSDDLLVRGLIHFGSRKCVERAIEIAKNQEDCNPAKWLAEQCRFCMWGLQGHSTGRYRIDVEVEPLLDFILSSSPDAETLDHLRSLIDDIDTPAVREVWRTWYDRRGTPDDLLSSVSNDRRMSDIAYRTLADRGDSHVLEGFLIDQIRDAKDHAVSSWQIERLARFDRLRVRTALISMIDAEKDEKLLGVELDFLGRIGFEEDVHRLAEFLESESDQVANAAHDARLRLIDPLRLPENW